jgi:hypothetical protein
MSVIADNVFEILNKLFPPAPYKRVFKEVYIKYKGQKLYFDFYIKELGVYVEVQGLQHEKFVKHFHGDASGLATQRSRDNLKIQYVEEEGKCLVRFGSKEKLTEELVKSKLMKVLEEGCFHE